jgi:hypothetical protein
VTSCDRRNDDGQALRLWSDAFNRLRTSIAGRTIKQTVTSARLTNGARYDLVVALSHRPAINGRPAGQYTLIYRFGEPAGRGTTGLTGIVSAPTPAAGSVQTLSPAADVAALRTT